MASAPATNVAALIVPHGKVVDFIDRRFRNDTPEEYVRQEIEKSIVREYLYPREEIAVEFPIKVGSARHRVDLAVFREGESHKQEHIWLIVECKAKETPRNDKKDGVEQLKSYLQACANAQFGLWTNGIDRFCCRKVTNAQGVISFEEEITDIPVKGKTLDDAERPTRQSLKDATSAALVFAFRRCHDYISPNQGASKVDAFWELLKVIFCKIADERADEIQFYATSQERQSLNGQSKVKNRIDRLFAEVRDKYRTIFKPNDVIELQPRVLAYIVAQLQPYSLLDSTVDVKGKAYEEIVNSNVGGERGEFFTPRNICKMAVQMVDPSPKHLILDPACGTGGFLITAMNHVLKKIEASEKKKWRKPDAPSQREQEEWFRKREEYLSTKIVGIDLNPNLVKATKMNMVMNNDGSGGLYQADSLAKPVTWSQELRDRNLMGTVDVVFTNPPFGAKLFRDDPVLLEQYDLAKIWKYDKAADSWAPKDPVQLSKSEPPEILFIERCVQFVKPGTGIVCLVLPDAILGAPGLAMVREWMLQNTKILASIDLHPDTFQPKNSTQTSLLVLQRKSFAQIELEKAAGKKDDYKIFMALANHIGHDKRGNITYVRDETGADKVETVPEQVREVHDNVTTVRTIETARKVVDDNTEDIAKRFREWRREQE